MPWLPYPERNLQLWQPELPALWSASVIAADRNVLLALQDLGDYAPLNAASSLALLLQLEAALTQAEQAEGRARRALDAARHRLATARRAFHEAILNAKPQVIAQCGADSVAVQAIGLRRKSERRRRAAAAPPARPATRSGPIGKTRGRQHRAAGPSRGPRSPYPQITLAKTLLRGQLSGWATGSWPRLA